MVRPCFLVIDHEHAGTISTRKLVIESAKLNVLTAFSGEEALAMLKKFPQRGRNRLGFRRQRRSVRRNWFDR